MHYVCAYGEQLIAIFCYQNLSLSCGIYDPWNSNRKGSFKVISFFFHTLKDTAFSLFSRFKIQQTLKINGNVFIRPNYGRFNFAKI
jgi:hypothetical protein